MENPVTRIAAKFQYKFLSLRTLALRLREVVRIEIVVLSYKDLEVGRPQLMWTLSSAPIWEIGAEKRLVECYCCYYIYYNCCCCCCCRWWYLLLGLLVLRSSISSLLPSATSVITKCDSLFYHKVLWSVTTKCNKCYDKVRQVLQSATEQMLNRA